ncbi:MAG: ClpXP protease specificity-enhancing factor [Betaproteobacteria bacterium]|nr:ClpXP protease specificity-enhancing factor [Betaproteobacteria bacterium]
MAAAEIPTKPYLLRALYEWCVDNGYTPHLALKVGSQAQVPLEYIKDGEITLNIAPSAVHKLQMGNQLIEFSARFGGVARQIVAPVASVLALYARETGQGMTFELEAPKSSVQADTAGKLAVPVLTAPAVLVPSKDATPALPGPEPTKPGGGKPQLRRIK